MQIDIKDRYGNVLAYVEYREDKAAPWVAFVATAGEPGEYWLLGKYDAMADAITFAAEEAGLW